MAKDVLGTVYETLLCTPGMNEGVKIDLKVSRKVVLLFSSVIENGLQPDQAKANLLALVPPADAEELRNFSDECLKKAGLKELSEKIKLF
ncbi:hypothetical protein FHW88_005015 [Mucilaginibacter sp. SG538B]|uniref:hypothetical protein n=1 Tax=Mucilaginibacter sp. SG538B TaxID=2587021 RepID=UPI00159E9837|nr:hypothetical protein [Mucilaginibacter sp. SG538B]NVM66697.1 hypothetical protein [Mucilaginibacter sp. SG538B]